MAHSAKAFLYTKSGRNRACEVNKAKLYLTWQAVHYACNLLQFSLCMAPPIAPRSPDCRQPLFPAPPLLCSRQAKKPAAGD